ncbi:high affinity choline transporter 1-like [Lytechinus variegatus]|uniref:high affinity choline transporter 1-like n=1 Tax=Lytechinus variegatus TaxID=7654 RepID=UPI001BB1B313|nr:high affinity choline transporter 1-like [Lytechinus variegatus]
MAVHWGGVAGMIVFYLIILLVGMWASKRTKGGDNPERVMVARRDIGWFVGFFTLVATWVGGGYINGTAEKVFRPGGGLLWTQAPIGYSLSFAVNGLFFTRKMRASNYVTMIDPFQIKYGSRFGGLLFVVALLGELLWCATILAALGSSIAVILELDQNLAVIISACIAAVYTLFGGLYSVAYTDIVQLILIFIGLWLAVPFAMTHEAVVPISETKDEWLGEWDNKLVGVWLDNWMLLIFGGVPWQAYYQRALAAKTPDLAVKLSYAATIGCLVMAIPAVIFGAVGSSTDWEMTNVNLNKTDPYEDASLVLPLIMQFLTPPFIAFMGLGAISAATMSSTDSSVLSSSSMFVRNIYSTIFRPKASDKEIIWVLRCTILVVTAIATILALTLKSIYTLFVLCSDLVYVILFPQLICVVHVPKANTYGLIPGLIIGLILRLGGGEEAIGMPHFIRYPFYDDDYGQLFPFRSLAMLVSLITTLVFSYGVALLFEKGYVSEKWDIFECFHVDDENEKNENHPAVKYELQGPENKNESDKFL